MEKKTIIIISLISAILSLIYILLSYFGLLRYAQLYLFPVEKYTKKYQNLDKIGDNRTIVSLTVTPDKMKKLTPTIKSLLDQTVKLDLFTVIIPYGNEYKMPVKLKDSVSIYRCGEDRKELNSLIPTLSREGESTTKIITLESGKVYGKDFIEVLLEESEQNPDKIIYVNDTDYIDLNKGVVFSTKFFDSKFIDPPKGVNTNKWVNDYFKDFPKKRISYGENYKCL